VPIWSSRRLKVSHRRDGESIAEDVLPRRRLVETLDCVAGVARQRRVGRHLRAAAFSSRAGKPCDFDAASRRFIADGILAAAFL
jgi:hypothetical protein